MWNKIYLLALAVLLLPMLFFTYYSYSWLQSISAPQSVVENFAYYSGIGWTYLWISTVILLVIANVLLWKINKAWALWATFFYFAFFVLIHYFLLETKYNTFVSTNFPAQSALPVGVFIAVVLCAVGAVIIYFDQFLVRRLRYKMIPQTDAPIAVNNEEENTEIN